MWHGVNVANSTRSFAWKGLVYRFFCAQCQERFVATPTLYTLPIPTKDIVAIPKQSKIRFVSPSEETLRFVCEKLLCMMGVSSAAPGIDCITVRYDLRQATLAQIEAVAVASRLVLGAVCIIGDALSGNFRKTMKSRMQHSLRMGLAVIVHRYGCVNS